MATGFGFGVCWICFCPNSVFSTLVVCLRCFCVVGVDCVSVFMLLLAWLFCAADVFVCYVGV